MIEDRYLTYVPSSAIKEKSVLKRPVESRGKGKAQWQVATVNSWKAPGTVRSDTRIRSHVIYISMPGIGPRGRSDEASTSSSIDLKINVDCRVRPPRFSLKSKRPIYYMTIPPLLVNLSEEFLSLASCNYFPLVFRFYKSLRILMVKIFPKSALKS